MSDYISREAGCETGRCVTSLEMHISLYETSPPPMCGLWCCAGIAATVTQKTASATAARWSGRDARFLCMTITSALMGRGEQDV